MKKIGNILLLIAIIANVYGALYFAIVSHNYVYSLIYVQIAFLLYFSTRKRDK